MMDQNVANAINQLQGIKQEKEKVGKTKKQHNANEAQCLEILQHHMESHGLNCLPLGNGQYAVLEEHHVKPSLKPEVVGFLFHTFFKLKGQELPPELRQEFETFVKKALITMTENEMKCIITKKRPVESYILKT